MTHHECNGFIEFSGSFWKIHKLEVGLGVPGLNLFGSNLWGLSRCLCNSVSAPFCLCVGSADGSSLPPNIAI